MFVQALQSQVSKLPSSAVKKILLHPAGPLTIFFWAPSFKWAITFSNIKDLEKPAENISTNMQIAVFLTGVLWSRYAMMVNPINYNLMLSNVFMAGSASY
mmetsp:Transcript_21002/g.29039  ORF Transcript_21002/g.29039 Transcript_21002/m.29039 type:complete len:100 (+) Transcript_21002:100-399(+)